MRLHLIIQRHGLPVTRILWTTTTSSSSAATISYKTPATSSAIASTRAPNASFANGDYSVAQLLEDVNEVVPLETEPRLFGDGKNSGQWGLEDYVVEVAGSECLHFMEVEGLLRDGDEVVIRALQISDLRARRLSGRHQISVDGRHLIDGVPFGRPYLKRSTSSRPAISIPPRKKRRTLGRIGGGYEEEDTVWAPTEPEVTGKELSFPENQGFDEAADEDYFEDYHEGEDEPEAEPNEEDGDGTVIRHLVEESDESELEDAHVSESDADISDFDDADPEDLTEELQGLKEDMRISGLDAGEMHEQPSRLKSTKSPEQKTVQEELVPEKSPSMASHLTTERSPGTRITSKSVRFTGQGEPASPASQKVKKSPVSAKEPSKEPISSDESVSSDSVSDSSSNTSSDEDNKSVSSDISTSDSEDSSSDSSSDSDLEIPESSFATAPETKINPPGEGSVRTKKSNQRAKLRRRLSKLKEFGVLPAEADFAALREWETTNGDWNLALEAKPTVDKKRQSKEQEDAEFQAKRQRLLRDLESGGVDIDIIDEKANVPSIQDDEEQRQEQGKPQKLKQEQPEDDSTMNDVEEPVKKRSLDIASTRRMLFGSLGVKTPRSKEDEEATRKKLAGKSNTFQSQRTTDQEQQPAEEPEDDLEENWQDKLVIRATECVFDDIELTAPPFPFEQRWDREAHEIIGRRKGWGNKKRKRKQRIQVYDVPEDEEYYEDGYGYEDGYDDGNGAYENGELELNYDDTERPQPNQEPSQMDGVEQTVSEIPESDTENELPTLPDDIDSIPEVAEDGLRKSAIIAFKQLDMSKATNWQPRVSEYRVAQIHVIFEDNVMKIRLAKRDRKQRKPHDANAGEEGEEEEEPRLYSGFEMPGFDDEEDGEDDGFREMSFTELIEPKILRAGEGAAATIERGDDATAQANLAVHSPVVEESVEDPRPSFAVAVEVPAVEVVNAVEEARTEQNLVMQTDGTNSVEGKSGANEMQEDNPGEREKGDSPVESPRFDGFEKSSRVEESSKSSPEQEEHVSQTDIGQNENNEQDAQRPSLHVPQESGDQSTGNKSIPLDSLDDGQGLNSEDLQPLSSPRSLPSFNGLLSQAFQDTEPVVGDSPPPAGAEGKGEAERGRDSQDDSPSHRSQNSFVSNPFYEIDKAHEERQRRASEKAKDRGNDDNNDWENNKFVGFSTPPVPAPRKTRKSQQKQESKAAPREESPVSSVPESQWHDPANPNPNLKDTKDKDVSTQSQSQEPPPSQMSKVVDLTQPSPPASPGGNDNEDYAWSNRLPRGSGWVRKRVPRSQQSWSQSQSQRRTRLSSSRVQTLKEVSISPPSPRGKRRRT